MKGFKESDPILQSDASPEAQPALQDLAALAASVCLCPTAMLLRWEDPESVGSHRPSASTPVLASFGASSELLARLDREPLPASAFEAAHGGPASGFLVADPARDPRFSDHPLSLGEPRPRFLAAAPVDGPGAGLLLLLDFVPRRLADRERRQIESLARQAGALLQLRSLQADHRRASIGRRLLEATLQEVQEQYSVTFDLAQVGIDHLDLRGRFIRVNDMFCRMLGYERDELMLLSLEQITHPEDYERDVQAIRDMISGKIDVFRTDKRYRHKTGRTVWCNLLTRLQRDKDGNPSYFSTIIQDITDRKLAERALVESESRLRWVFNNAAVGIMICDSNRRLLDINETFEKMLAYAKEELLRTSYDDLVHPEDLGTVRSQSYRLRVEGRGRSPIQYEVRLRSKTGKIVWARLTVSLGHQPAEATADSMSIIEDITERKEVERKIAEQQTKLIASSKMSALGEMSGGIAHEINNPLTIVHGKAIQIQRLAARPDADLAAIRASAENIETTALRISKIVRSLRSFSRDAENDRFENVRLLGIIEETLEFCRERLKNHEIDLRIDPIPRDVRVECRPVQISQVLLNLLNNAHDAIESLPERWIRLSVEDRDDWVKILVTDSGGGVPRPLAEKIMQPFFTTKELGHGTGLGLSVSKGIVESHQGSLQLDESCPNTRFVVTLPKRVQGARPTARDLS